MRTIFVFLFALALWSCKSKSEKKVPVWPDMDQVKVTWQLLDDAVQGDNKRTSIFTITNESSIEMPSGWNLYFSLLPTAIYLPASAEMKYDITNLGGDYYRISTLDSFPVIHPGESRKIQYQWPVGILKKTHTPHGLFFVLDDGSVYNVEHYDQNPIPTTLTFDNQGKKEPMHISAEKRFGQYEDIEDLPVSKLSPILPTPKKISMGQGGYPLLSGVKVLFDRGLENEANKLAATLNKVLQNGATTDEDYASEQAIYLKLDSTSQIDDPEGYELKILADRISITGSTPAGVFYGIQSFKSLIPAAFFKVPTDQIFLPILEISDEPRFKYRGQHIDVARNFQPVSEIKKMIDVMAYYKLNKLHFHLTDDEGWRLEIPDLPELTDVGARRGFSRDDHSMLPPAYGSGGIADSSLSSGTGYYTREEFIDLLKYARENHIEVIPEINGPGHARAAIIAMQNRYEILMAAGREADARAYLLSDPNDASKYSSAQNYHDNVICVCQEYTYTFLEKVISEVAKMYQEAGAPLSLIHTGGDEVPHGAWTESPECKRLIKDEATIESVNDLHPYFVKRYLEIAAKHNLKIGGWEEITLKHLPEGNAPNPEFLNQGVVSYAWNAIVGGGGEDMAYQLANLGYEVVMCNASNLYFDLAYTYEPEEPGLFWAGYIDTKNAFELTPSNIFLSIQEDELGNPLDGLALSRQRVPLLPGAEQNIIGIQGALWSETLKNEQMAEYMLLPKLMGLAERAWSSAPSWAGARSQQEIKSDIKSEWSKFANRVGKLELPKLDYLSGGYFYRISPPGAEIKGGKLFINSEYPGLQLRYTTDGSDPNPYSTLYENPVDVPRDANTIKVRAFNTDGRGSRLVELDIPLAN